MLYILYYFLPVISNVTMMNILVATSFFLIAKFWALLCFLRIIYHWNFDVQKLRILLTLVIFYKIFLQRSCTAFPILLATPGITVFHRF